MHVLNIQHVSTSFTPAHHLSLFLLFFCGEYHFMDERMDRKIVGQMVSGVCVCVCVCACLCVFTIDQSTVTPRLAWVLVLIPTTTVDVIRCLSGRQAWHEGRSCCGTSTNIHSNCCVEQSDRSVVRLESEEHWLPRRIC